MEAMHVAEAEAKEKAHQEGKPITWYSSKSLADGI